jgi:hypothetical protein
MLSGAGMHPALVPSVAVEQCHVGGDCWIIIYSPPRITLRRRCGDSVL